MDMEEDTQIPIMLRRPFLANDGSSIDVKCVTLTFYLRRDENIEFLSSKLMKTHTFNDSCCRFDIVDRSVKECSFEPSSLDILEMYLI